MRIRNPFSKKAFFNRYRKKKYKAFLRANYEWDYGYLIDMMILKLTLMGIEFYRFGFSVECKQTAHKVWTIRKALIQSRQAFDFTEEKGQKKFMKKYGFPHEYEMLSTLSENKRFYHLSIKVKTPTPVSQEKEEEMNRYWNEVCPHDAEYKREKECLDKAFSLLARDIQSLSD